MLDAQAGQTRGVQVDFDVALRVDDHRHAFRAGHIRGVGQATKIELLKIHPYPIINRLLWRTLGAASAKSSSPMVYLYILFPVI